MRAYPAGPVLAAAAILFQGDDVLLIRRLQEPNRGLWTFPGGAVELGETTRQCAAREVLEETGLEAEILEVVEVVDAIFRDERDAVAYHYGIVDFLARPVAGTLRPASDALEARWVPVNQASALPLAPPSDRVLRRAWNLWTRTSSAGR